MTRILFFNRSFYFDDTNGASVASRALLEALARRGFVVRVVCGACVDEGTGDARALLGSRVGEPVAQALVRSPNVSLGAERFVRVLNTRNVGVALTTLDAPLRRHDAPKAEEAHDLLALLDAEFFLNCPDVLVTYGGDPLTLAALRGARIAGIKTVFVLHNFQYKARSVFQDVEHVVVPSEYSSSYYRRRLGLECTVLPNIVDPARVAADRQKPRYVTFVNPSAEKGVYAFARIAEELGKRRPEIRFLVVESRGDESTLAGCGLDLRTHGNVFLMANTADPRRFWAVTRVCLMPSLFQESQGLVAVEAMVNGIPVIGSDRGALPETLGRAGIVLPLPAHLTPSTRHLPSPVEVAPWVEAIIRIWDDPELYDEHRRRAVDEAVRWSPRRLEPRYVQFFNEVATGVDVEPSPTRLPE